MASALQRPDPNKDRNDPMVPEYWMLGEDFQDRIRAAGYEAAEVDGIAVDIHDLLQASERIRELVESSRDLDAAKLRARLKDVSAEFDHIRWHCDAAVDYLSQATEAIEG